MAIANAGIDVTAVSQYIQLPVHAYFCYENKYCFYVKYPASSKLCYTQREKIFGIWFPVLQVIYFCVLCYCVDIFNPSCHLEYSLRSWPFIPDLAIALKKLMSTVSVLPLPLPFFLLPWPPLYRSSVRLPFCTSLVVCFVYPQNS